MSVPLLEECYDVEESMLRTKNPRGLIIWALIRVDVLFPSPSLPSTGIVCKHVIYTAGRLRRSPSRVTSSITDNCTEAWFSWERKTQHATMNLKPMLASFTIRAALLLDRVAPFILDQCGRGLVLYPSFRLQLLRTVVSALENPRLKATIKATTST